MTKKAKGRAQVLAELLQDKPHAIGAEIGVERGKMTSRLLSLLPDIKIYICVDPYEAYEGYTGDGLFKHCEPGHEQELLDAYRMICHARLELWHQKIIWCEQPSETVAALLRDHSLDWAFIDANHHYEYVIRDITLWGPKVRPGGLLSGHDYGKRQVTQAVDEMCPARELGSNETWWVWV